MSANSNEKIAQFYSAIEEKLRLKDISSTIIALRGILGLMSRGVSVSRFIPSVLKFVGSENDDIEILSHAIFIQNSNLTQNEIDSFINQVKNNLQSKNECKKLLAIKDLSTLSSDKANQALFTFIISNFQEQTSYVRKACIIAAAKLYKSEFIPNSDKTHLIELISDSFKSNDPVCLSGSIFASEIIQRTDLIQNYSESLWNSILALDPWSQSRCLHHLLSNNSDGKNSSASNTSSKITYPDPAKEAILQQNSPIANALLHTSNTSVLIEVSKLFIDGGSPKQCISPLLSLIQSSQCVAIGAFSCLHRIAQVAPDQLVPYANHFFPPQNSQHASYYCVKILSEMGELTGPEYLFRWATSTSSFADAAAYSIGIIAEKNKEFVQSLLGLVVGDRNVAEIAASFISKFIDEITLASMIEMRMTAATVSVFADCVKKFPSFGEALLEKTKINDVVDDKEVMYEMLLLSARLIEMKSSEKAKQFLEMAMQNKHPEISRRAKMLLTLSTSNNPNLRKTIWVTKDPPPPPPPAIFIPDY